ncbi:hypothetical protein G5O_0272 [Chlamydia psittaci 6BC]|nr:hypothetical protein G5O_0272 [Chlamydia psittaci 6BC]
MLDVFNLKIFLWIGLKRKFPIPLREIGNQR